MRYQFGALLVGALAIILAHPTSAAPNEAHQIRTWQSQLRQAVCMQNWSKAIGVSAALVGSEIPANERLWLLALRQDLFAYQRGTVSFLGCEGNALLAGATPESIQLLTSASAADWQATLTSMGISSSAASVSTRLEVVDTAGVQVADTACQPRLPENFRVASGTISNRWVYEIWRQVDSFYVQYWRQSQSCAEALSTGGFATQQEAYEFARNLQGNESVGNIR